MGNSNTRESRGGDAGHRSHRHSLAPNYESGGGPSLQSDRPASRRNRVSRADLGGILGLGSSGGSSSHPEPPYERRETRQEREARRLEKERVARIKERERSLKEEHVDGGYLVTLGTYTGPEDFNKQIVRQLQIERKLAPFWRGLNDIDPNWTEPQIIAAARGLPIPAADETPPDELIPRPLSADSPATSTQNLNNLMVPMGDRTLSAASDNSVSYAGSALPSPIGNGPARTSSPFKPRGKALAAVLGGSSRNASTTEIVPREINLPNDPFVNGQPLEVFLYKAATECPICFLSCPPYLNHTRCCDQEICSECFVQIKRPDPHFPEGHNENDPNNNPEEQAGMLVSEPACCPYCTQPDFGVTYEPPPFRRGLAYAISPAGIGAANTAMSSSSSLNSSTLSPLASPTTAARRRAHSLSTHAPNVILTDRVRPEWATKLQNARAHQARRAAAATALHTAAFLMSNAETARTFRVSRFSRRNTGGSSTPTANAGTPAPAATEGDNSGSGAGTPPQTGADAARASSGRSQLASGPRSSGRNRMEDLEEMMFMEAIRLSLAEEENRKRKEEKEERKQAKKREKEERKAQKAAAKHGGPYDASGQSSASGSSLSLPGFGRKRGNSAASNLRVEASVASAVATSGSSSPVADLNAKDKGKTVDRGLPSTPEGVETTGNEEDAGEPTVTAAPTTSAPRPIPAMSPRPSHLRQMSSASSVSSSLPDSQAGSYQSPHLLQDPRASGLSLGSRSAASDDGGDHDRDPSSSTEPMFNFRSLAEVVGVTLEGEHAGRRISRIEAEKKAKESGEAPAATSKADEGSEPEVERVEDAGEGESSQTTMSVATLLAEESQTETKSKSSGISLPPLDVGQQTPPKLTITPETPAPMDDDASEDSKQLGYTTTTVEQAHQVAQ